MFERFDDVDWKKIEKAQEIPVLSRGCFEMLVKPSANAEQRRKALFSIELGVFDQACPVKTTPLAIALLGEVLDKPKAADKWRILQLLGSIACLGYDRLLDGLDERAPVWAKLFAGDMTWRHSYAVLRQRVPQHLPFLHDTNTKARAAAAYLLAWFARDSSAILPALRGRLGKEKDAVVRATLLLAIAQHLRYQKSRDVSALTPELTAKSPLLATSAAIAIALVAPQGVDEPVIERLTCALSEAELDDTGLRFAGGNLRVAALQVLARVAAGQPRVLTAIAARLSDAAVVEKKPLRNVTFGQRAAGALLDAALPTATRKALEKDTLPEAARSALAALVAAPEAWTPELREALARRGLPNEPIALGRWLGQVEASILVRTVRLGKRDVTVEDALVAQIRPGGRFAPEATVAAIVDALAPAELVTVVEEAGLERFSPGKGWRVPPPKPRYTLVFDEEKRREARAWELLRRLLAAGGAALRPSLEAALARAEQLSVDGNAADWRRQGLRAILTLALGDILIAAGAPLPPQLEDGLARYSGQHYLLPHIRRVMEHLPAVRKVPFMQALAAVGCNCPLHYLDLFTPPEAAELFEASRAHWQADFHPRLLRWLLDNGQGATVDRMLEREAAVQAADKSRREKYQEVYTFTRSDGRAVPLIIRRTEAESLLEAPALI